MPRPVICGWRLVWVTGTPSPSRRSPAPCPPPLRARLLLCLEGERPRPRRRGFHPGSRTRSSRLQPPRFALFWRREKRWGKGIAPPPAFVRLCGYAGACVPPPPRAPRLPGTRASRANRRRHDSHRAARTRVGRTTAAHLPPGPAAAPAAGPARQPPAAAAAPPAPGPRRPSGGGPARAAPPRALPRRGALPSLGDVVPAPGLAGGASAGNYVSQAPLLLGRAAGRAGLSISARRRG